MITALLLLAISNPGMVTHAEFDSVDTSMTKHEVNTAWDATGTFAVTYYDGVGNEHRVREYTTTEKTLLTVDFERKLNEKRFHYFYAEWPS